MLPIVLKEIGGEGENEIVKERVRERERDVTIVLLQLNVHSHSYQTEIVYLYNVGLIRSTCNSAIMTIMSFIFNKSIKN